MANAADLITFAMAAVNRQPPLLYGQRAINGLSQRGPDSYDCIGFYRYCVLNIAPTLWPTSWNGPDSWTVPNYYGAIQGRFPIDNGPAGFGDCLIWIDNSGTPQHIGISDGMGNVISALNTVQNICIVPARTVNWPIMKVVHTGLEIIMVPIGTPIGVARIGTDPLIRGLGPKDEPYVLPLGSDVVTYGEVTRTGDHPGLAFVIAEPKSGIAINLLERNTTQSWLIGVDANSTTLQAKINKAIADLS